MFYSQAGIASEQLIIALEPEGGAIFCRERSLKDFAYQKGDANISDVFTLPNCSYAMVDIGGNSIASYLTIGSYVSVRSSRYEARGKLSKLLSMNAQLTYEPIV